MAGGVGGARTGKPGGAAGATASIDAPVAGTAVVMAPAAAGLSAVS